MDETTAQKLRELLSAIDRRIADIDGLIAADKPKTYPLSAWREGQEMKRSAWLQARSLIVSTFPQLG